MNNSLRVKNEINIYLFRVGLVECRINYPILSNNYPIDTSLAFVGRYLSLNECVIQSDVWHKVLARYPAI